MKRFWILLLLAAACTQGKPEVPILNYHSVGEPAGEFTVTPEAFAQELDWLLANGFHTVSLHDLAQSRVDHRKLLPRSIVLTFDDGTEDALRLVLPALQKRHLRATFFIITGSVGKPGYLTWDGVRALATAGMEIGSHTVSHARLADVSSDQVESELRESRRQLESHLGMPIEALAYPYNSLRWRIVRVAEAAGYRIAVAGPAHGTSDGMRLLRIPIDGRAPPSQIEQLLR